MVLYSTVLEYTVEGSAMVAGQTGRHDVGSQVKNSLVTQI